MMIEISNQNFIFFFGLVFVGVAFLKIKASKIKMEDTSAITPPSLEGMDRKITYANKKYHSG